MRDPAAPKPAPETALSPGRRFLLVAAATGVLLLFHLLALGLILWFGVVLVTGALLVIILARYGLATPMIRALEAQSVLVRLVLGSIRLRRGTDLTLALHREDAPG